MQSPDAMASGAESAHTTTAITATAARHTRMTPVLYHAQLGPIVVMRRSSVAWRGGLIHHPQHPRPARPHELNDEHGRQRAEAAIQDRPVVARHLWVNHTS